MTQDKETLREAVARAIHSRSGKGGILWRDLLDDEIWEFEAYADAAIATMFERLRTASEGMIEAGSGVPCDDDVAGGVVYSTAAEAKAIWQAMLAAFQQENSDER